MSRKLKPLAWCGMHGKNDYCGTHPVSICAGCGMYNGAHSAGCGYINTEIHRKLDEILKLLKTKHKLTTLS